MSQIQLPAKIRRRWLDPRAPKLTIVVHVLNLCTLASIFLTERRLMPFGVAQDALPFIFVTLSSLATANYWKTILSDQVARPVRSNTDLASAFSSILDDMYSVLFYTIHPYPPLTLMQRRSEEVFREGRSLSAKRLWMAGIFLGERRLLVSLWISLLPLAVFVYSRSFPSFAIALEGVQLIKIAVVWVCASLLSNVLALVLLERVAHFSGKR
jgi:hypothetical protein